MRKKSSEDNGSKKQLEVRGPRHGLYCDPNKIKIDGRSFFGKLRKKIRGHLLEVFKGDPSPIVQTLADGTAANVIMAKAFQASFLRGDKLPPTIMRDYATLWNAISRDLATLHQMARESGPQGDKFPLLADYLKMSDEEKELFNAKKTGKLVVVEGQKEG
jgi:hypothetical protein